MGDSKPHNKKTKAKENNLFCSSWSVDCHLFSHYDHHTDYLETQSI
jgi:hypothetical protein